MQCSPEPVRESVVVVYSDAGCTDELGVDGFPESRREFMALPHMPAECVPDAGECFVLTEACRAAHASRFNHWATEYGGSANVAAIQITSWSPSPLQPSPETPTLPSLCGQTLNGSTIGSPNRIGSPGSHSFAPDRIYDCLLYTSPSPRD